MAQIRESQEIGLITTFYGGQQNLHAALAAVPWLLACSGLRGEDRARQGKNDVHFACRARAAPTTKWLAAKTPPAISSCKFHVVRNAKEGRFMLRLLVLSLSLCFLFCKSTKDSQKDSGALRSRDFLESKYKLYSFPPKPPLKYPFEKFGWLTEPFPGSYVTDYSDLGVNLDTDGQVTLIGHSHFSDHCKSATDYADCHNDSDYYYAKAGDTYIFIPMKPARAYFAKIETEAKYEREKAKIARTHVRMYDSQQAYDPLPENCYMDFQQKAIESKQAFFRQAERVFITRNPRFLKWFAAQSALASKYGFDPEKSVDIVVCGTKYENRQYTLNNYHIAELPTYKIDRIIVRVDGQTFHEF